MGLDVVLSEFVATLRRAGVPVSPAQAIDACRAAAAVGLLSREDLRTALRAVLVRDGGSLPTFERTFRAFWCAAGEIEPDLYERLALSGFCAQEIDALRRLLGALASGDGLGGGVAALTGGSGERERLLYAAADAAGISRIQSPLQVGYFATRVLEQAGEPRVRAELAALSTALDELLGARGRDLAGVVAAELVRLRAATRHLVEQELHRRSPMLREQFRAQQLLERPWTELSREETARVHAEVIRLADKISGAFSVRRKRSRRGRLDVRKSLRGSHRTGGLPFELATRRRKRDRPKLVVLCDVSESVRFAARFLLVLVYSLQDVFSRTRSFVFVSDVGEVTELFAAHPIELATQLAYGGAAVSVAANSNYGRALRGFVERYLDALDSHTTVLILGDGRNNYHDPCPQALATIRRRAARVIWLNPEPRGAWGFGDSAVLAYLPHCDEAHPAFNLNTLRGAIQRLARM